MALKRIDVDSVHKICSGQVVLTLAIAVKELVENSLDAGATSVEVRLRDSGLETIEVIDNGSGICPENYEALTLKHFTSKITDFDDVAFVETFGFRGEALSSLCALSNLVVVSRHGNQQAGSRIEYDCEGKITTITKCPREVGTTVILSNLFHTLPVRRKEFQRNIKKEYGRMIRLLQAYALITEDVKISCYNQQSGSNSKRQLILSSLRSGKMIDNISCLFGPKQVDLLVPFIQCSSFEETESSIVMTPTVSLSSDLQDLFSITGYVSKCNHGYGRSTTDRQFFYLNGRPCEHPKLSKTVNEVYHMFNRHQYPFVCLNIKTNTRDKVDVNLTPDKRTVLVQEEKLLLSIVKDSLLTMYDPMQGQIQQSSPSIRTSLYPVTPTDTPTDSGSNVSSSHMTVLTTPTPTATPTDVMDQESPGIEVIKATPLSPPFSQSSASDKLENDISIISSNKDTTSSLQRYSHQSVSSNVNKNIPKSKQPKLTDFGISKATPTNQSDILPYTAKGKLTSKPAPNSSVVLSLSSDNGTQAKDSQSKKTGKTIEFVTKTVHTNIDMIGLRQKWLVSNQCKDGQGNDSRRYFHAKIVPDSNQQAEDELKKELKKDDFKEMEVIGQFNNGFIIAKLGDHLFIVDQHATDEKFNYERFQRDTEIEHQTLIQPMSLELTNVGESIVIENKEIFAKNGFFFEIDETAPPTKRVKLIGQPVSKQWSMGVTEIEELIFLLTDYPGEMVRPSCVNKMFAMRACRGSIMIGTPLNRQEMKKLLIHMSEMKQPWNCPHGRPTIRHLVDLSKLSY